MGSCSRPAPTSAEVLAGLVEHVLPCGHGPCRDRGDQAPQAPLLPHPRPQAVGRVRRLPRRGRHRALRHPGDERAAALRQPGRRRRLHDREPRRRDHHRAHRQPPRDRRGGRHRHRVLGVRGHGGGAGLQGADPRRRLLPRHLPPRRRRKVADRLDPVRADLRGDDLARGHAQASRLIANRWDPSLKH
nr:hypothetical protein [Nocardioides convexus]